MESPLRSVTKETYKSIKVHRHGHLLNGSTRSAAKKNAFFYGEQCNRLECNWRNSSKERYLAFRKLKSVGGRQGKVGRWLQTVESKGGALLQRKRNNL